MAQNHLNITSEHVHIYSLSFDDVFLHLRSTSSKVEYHPTLEISSSNGNSLNIQIDDSSCDVNYTGNEQLFLRSICVQTLTININGESTSINAENISFKRSALHFDVKSIYIGRSSKRQLKINTLKRFAECIFTPEELEEVMKY